VDRGIATPGFIHDSVLLYSAMLGLASGFGPAETEMLAGTARQCLSPSADHGPQKKRTLDVAVLVSETMPRIEAAAANDRGIRYYPSSEYLLTHQRGWFAAVRMASIRTKMWNSQNGQHIHGSSSSE